MSLSETEEFNDFVVDDVVTNMFPVFQDEDVEESVLQQLKEMWRSKIEKRSEVDSDLAKTSGGTEKEALGADATGVKEKPVPVPPALSNMAPFITQSADVVNVTAAVPQVVHFSVPLWVLEENKLPLILRNPLLLHSSTKALQLRVNMAVDQLKKLPDAMQLDGGLTPIKEEDLDEDLESPSRRIPGDDEPLNSDDDPVGEDAADEDLFETRNVIACQYQRVVRCRQKWRFDLTNGVMSINGRDYVFKHLSGEAVW